MVAAGAVVVAVVVVEVLIVLAIVLLVEEETVAVLNATTLATILTLLPVSSQHRPVAVDNFIHSGYITFR